MVKPIAVNIRAYNVGFGDSFLVSFQYGEKDHRSVLIDFGSTGKPKAAPSDVMKKVADDVAKFVADECKGVLHGVVATHRHKDHISGFAGASGAVIEKLSPKVVIQPWTEDPLAKSDAKSATKKSSAAAPKSLAAMKSFYVQSFADMSAFSEAALKITGSRVGKQANEDIRFLAAENIANREAIERLARMGKKGKAEYVRAGDKTSLEKQLPGVKVHILGPPDLTQTETILKQRSSDKNEFWQFMQNFSLHAVGSAVTARPLFPGAKTVRNKPIGTRWFVDRANRQMGQQLLGLVRVLDKAMNNTSVILLFEVGGKKLLFPGDAQIENWAFALSEPKVLAGVKALLADVDLYKVGHHGSRNATPKTLWKGFTKRAKTKKVGRLTSVVSTMPGKHGTKSKQTEVPRTSLIEALSAESHFHDTENLKPSELFEPVVIKLK